MFAAITTHNRQGNKRNMRNLKRLQNKCMIYLSKGILHGVDAEKGGRT